MSDVERIRAARDGDRTAMGALVDAFGPEAMRLALHLSREPADAEDAVQTAFVLAFSHLDRFDTTRPFRPWFMRIVANACRRQQRDSALRWRFWRSRHRSEDAEASAESAVIVRAEHEALYAALRTLRVDDRTLLVLTYFEGWSEAELAQMLEIPRGTVKSRKHAAMQRLRSQIADPPVIGNDDVRPEVTS